MSFTVRCLACGQTFEGATLQIAKLKVHDHVGGSRRCQLVRQVERERRLLAARSGISPEPAEE